MLPDLTDAFEAAGLIDVAYTVDDSPLGPLLLAATTRGLVQIGFDDSLERVSAGISPRVIRAPRRLDQARRELEQYFAGTRQAFDLALDRRLIRPGFFSRVLRATTAIPYGDTSTYMGVASGAGSPRAYRSAGTALGDNPLPIVIPCHRVLHAGGGLGGYAGGPERKQILLGIEGAARAVRR